MGRRPVRRGEADPLKIGLMTVFESPVLSLEGPGDRARGVGRGVQRARRRQRLVHRGHHLRRRRPTSTRPSACVRTIDDAGVVATVNDQGTAGQAEVSEAMAAAGIPRVASNVDQRRLGRPERLPARRVRHRRHVPAAAGAHRRRTSTKIGLIRVDLAAASALIGPPRAASTRARPRSRTTSRCPAAPPTSASSSSAPQNDGRGRRRRSRSASRRPSRS